VREYAVIILSDTVIEPYAVVIEALNTLVAPLAMFYGVGNSFVADLAVKCQVSSRIRQRNINRVGFGHSDSLDHDKDR
jgi:hypothetical protein